MSKKKQGASRGSDMGPDSGSDAGVQKGRGSGPTSGPAMGGLSGLPAGAGVRSLSIVIPTLGHEERLNVSLAAVVREVEARGIAADEILVVDDSGSERASASVPAVLGGEEGDRRAKVRVVSTGEGENRGFGAAVLKGMKEARNPLVVVVHDDVALQAGSLDAMGKAITQPGSAAPSPESVFAVAPSVKRAGAEEGAPAETAATLTLVDDRLTVFEGAPGGASKAPLSGEDDAAGPRVASFIPSSAFLMRKSDFLDVGGFDSLFAPFGWEDVDLSLAARRRGRILLEVPAAKAVHGLGDGVDPMGRDAKGMGDASVSADLADRVIERNRLLLRWKHLSTRAEATEHLVSLWRSVLEAGLAGDRETLEDVCLAFEKLGDVTQSRAKVAGTTSLEGAL